ncbi:MAG: hypothetical protein QF797_15165 [Alphaproteobacteria bacterium]|nr:hypothetical protein [Rhodospirillaceae bacterium]MDP6406534.1 hypothetical protein [Alphaproteobacteria bacterium]MDP6620983.1 hypothetical protein [Alphaproteobacteria bacterium]
MNSYRWTIAVTVLLLAMAPFAGSAKEICEVEKNMFGFEPEPSQIAIGPGGTNIEIHHAYKSPSTMKTSEHLTCRLHLGCTVASGVATLTLPVEITELGLSSVRRKLKVVRLGSNVEFKNAAGAVVQSCRIVRIGDK